MPKLKKIHTYIETLSKSVEAHTSYYEKKFRVVLAPEFEDFAAGLPMQDERSRRYRDTKPNKENTFQLFKWWSMGKNRIGVVADTEDEAADLWKKFIQHFYKQGQTVEKVILYKVKFSSLSINQNDGYEDETETENPKRTKYWRMANDADSDSNEARVAFDFMVCEKRSIGNTYGYFFIDKEGDTGRIGSRYSYRDDGGLPHSWRAMPYTPEAEAFFTEIYKGLEGIMEKLSKHAGNTERVLKSIESTVKFLA